MNSTTTRFMGMPRTRLGWWAVGLTLLFTLLFVSVLNEWIRFSGMLIVILGIAGGIVTLVALIKERERSLLVWLMLLPGLFAIAIALRSILASL